MNSTTLRSITITSPVTQHCFDSLLDSPMSEICTAVPTASDVSTDQEPKPRTTCTGILAFVVGTMLSLAAWISNQGWAVCSVLFFGDLSSGNVWKHILFSIVGSLIIAFAWSLSFRSCFHGHDELDDLGEIGFIFGYILAEYLGIGIFYPNEFDMTGFVFIAFFEYFALLWDSKFNPLAYKCS